MSMLTATVASAATDIASQSDQGLDHLMHPHRFDQMIVVQDQYDPSKRH